MNDITDNLQERSASISKGIPTPRARGRKWIKQVNIQPQLGLYNLLIIILYKYMTSMRSY